MEEEKYEILSDLKNIEEIIKENDLWDERVRRELMRLLCHGTVFRHRIGSMFLESLRQPDCYRSSEEQEKLLDDCRNFAAILKRCRTGRIDDLEKLRQIVSEEDNQLFQSWMKQPAVYYIDRYLRYRKRNLCLEANRHQNEDLAAIYSLSSRYVFDREEDANRLYELLLTQKGELFRSWIGAAFAERIQKRTTGYRRMEKRRRRLRKTAAVCAGLACLACFLLARAYLDDYKHRVEAQELDAIRSAEGAEAAQGQSDAGEGDGELLAEYQTLCAVNPDLIGWLRVEGLDISLPVMQSTEEDGFYLNHNFYREEEKRGTLFVDAGTEISPLSDNVVIYGHNMNDGTMFGQLKRYEDRDFYLEHAQFSFDTIYHTGVYEIVGVVKTHVLKKEEEGFRYYRFYRYETREEFQEFADFIRQYRLYETGKEITYGDTFVILSTCEYSVDQGRLLVIGRRVL